MRNKTLLLLAVFYLMSCFFIPALSAEENSEPNKLLIIYSSADKEVFTKFAFVYAINAKKQGWWQDVTFITWGPSNKTIANDEELKEKIKQLKDAGVKLQACKWCAEQYEVDGILSELGVEVKYMGQPLTEMLKSDWKVLTF